MREKLSWKRAERVVRAYRAGHGMSADVDLSTLATSLGTSENEVRRLAGRRRRFIDRSGILSATLASVAAGMLALFVFSPVSDRPTGEILPRPHAVGGRAARVVVIDINTGADLWTYPESDSHPRPETTL